MLLLWTTKQAPLRPLPSHVKQASWKRQLAYYLEDAKRTRLHEDELVSAAWQFRFLIDLKELHMAIDEREQSMSRERDVLRFQPDGFYTSTIPGAPSSVRPLRWRLIFDRANEDERGHSFLQIRSYPVLKVERTADWGWRMHNKFVEFYTAPKECGDKDQKGAPQVSGDSFTN